MYGQKNTKVLVLSSEKKTRTNRVQGSEDIFILILTILLVKKFTSLMVLDRPLSTVESFMVSGLNEHKITFCLIWFFLDYVGIGKNYNPPWTLNSWVIQIPYFMAPPLPPSRKVDPSRYTAYTRSLQMCMRALLKWGIFVEKFVKLHNRIKIR